MSYATTARALQPSEGCSCVGVDYQRELLEAELLVAALRGLLLRWSNQTTLANAVRGHTWLQPSEGCSCVGAGDDGAIALGRRGKLQPSEGCPCVGDAPGQRRESSTRWPPQPSAGCGLRWSMRILVQAQGRCLVAALGGLLLRWS